MGKIKRNYDNEGNLISKECTCCREVKLVSEFHKHIRKIDGLHSECKECSKKYYQENKESKKEYRKEHYQKNKYEFNEKQKKYYQKNKYEFNEKQKKYYQENKDRINKSRRKYRIKQIKEALQQNKKEIESNPEKYNYREGEKIYGVIYLVHNIKSNKYYVGQTTTAFDIRYPSGWLHEHGRKNEVKEDLELYGENSFEYNKLFKVAYSQHDLDILEAHYIDCYDSYENGYNGNRGNIFTDRGKEK